MLNVILLKQYHSNRIFLVWVLNNNLIIFVSPAVVTKNSSKYDRKLFFGSRKSDSLF